MELIGKNIINEKIMLRGHTIGSGRYDADRNLAAIDREKYKSAIDMLRGTGDYSLIIEYVLEHIGCRQDMSPRLIEEIIRKELKFVQCMELILFNETFWDCVAGDMAHAHQIRINPQLIEAVREYKVHDDMAKLVHFLTTKIQIDLPYHYCDGNGDGDGYDNGYDTDEDLTEKKSIEFMIKEEFEFSIKSIEIGTKYKIVESEHSRAEYIEYYYPDEWSTAGNEIIQLCRGHRAEYLTFLEAGKAILSPSDRATGLTRFVRLLNHKNRAYWANHVASFL